MIIEKIRLRNFGPFEDFTAEFSPRMNLIVGRNGDGKSTLLRAMQGAITGDFNSIGKKEEDIRQGTPARANSYVRLNMSHAGLPFNIRRNLRSTDELSIDGVSDWRTAGEINGEILRRLGATKKQISEYVFVNQERVKAMLDKTQTERGKEFASLFGLEKPETIWRELGKYATAVSVPVSMINVDEARTGLAETSTTVTSLEASLAELPEPDEELAALELERDALKELERQDSEFRLAVSTVTSQIATDNNELDQVLAKSQPLSLQIGEYQAAITGMADAVAAAELAIPSWALYESHARARRQSEIQAEQLLLVKHAIPAEPEVPARERPDEQFVSDAKSNESKYSGSDIELVRLRGIQPGEACPTCGQLGGDIAIRITELLSVCSEEEHQQIVADNALILDWAEHDRLTLHKQTEQARYDRQILAHNAANMALGISDEPGMSRAEATQIIADRDQLRTAITADKATLQALTERQEVLSDRGRVAIVDLRVKEEALAALPAYDSDRVNAIGNRRTELGEVRRRRGAIYQHLITTRGQVTHWQSRIDEYATVMNQARNVRYARDYLETLRTPFHRDEGPRMVSFTYLEQMERDINEVLGIFSAPYRIKPDETLGFTATFLDGSRSHSDRRLSVGQRIVLAISARITVNSTFAGNLGLLSLDEPTAGLDAHNLDCLPLALERLRDLSDARGLQIFFVTHDSDVRNLFDTVTEVA